MARNSLALTSLGMNEHGKCAHDTQITQANKHSWWDFSNNQTVNVGLLAFCEMYLFFTVGHQHEMGCWLLPTSLITKPVNVHFSRYELSTQIGCKSNAN